MKGEVERGLGERDGEGRVKGGGVLGYCGVE